MERSARRSMPFRNSRQAIKLLWCWCDKGCKAWNRFMGFFSMKLQVSNRVLPQLLLQRFDYIQKFGSDQAGATHESSIHIRTGEQFPGVGPLHAPPIQDGNRICDVIPVLRSQHGPEMRMHFLRLGRSGRLTGTDGPDGFIGDHDFADLLFGKMKQGLIELLLYKLILVSFLADR